MTFHQELFLEVVKFALGLGTLSLGWFYGQQIVAYWDIRKKRQELDIAAARDFHNLYGEFREVSRIWRAIKYDDSTGTKIEFEPQVRLELMRRAASAEGKIESLIVKLASERELTGQEIKTLGLFRQAYQRLREAIRNGDRFEWTRGSPEYHLYNTLTSTVAFLIDQEKIRRQTSSVKAAKQLAQIAAVTPQAWDQAVKDLAAPTR
jgi:hypothetical protein